MDITLINYMKEQLELVSLAFKRYNYDKLPWEASSRFDGPRGVASLPDIATLKRAKLLEEQLSHYVQPIALFHHQHAHGRANRFVVRGHAI